LRSVAGVQAGTWSGRRRGRRPGCVELPLAAAAQAWPFLTYGSLVTVSP